MKYTYFDRDDYSDLGLSFYRLLPDFARDASLREEAEDALRTVLDEVMGQVATGCLVEFAANHFINRTAEDVHVTPEEAEYAGWHIQQMCGYPGGAQALKSGFAISIVPGLGYDIYKQGEVLQRVGNRYHLVHNGNHFGLCDNMTQKGHRLIAICLYGHGDDEAALADAWVTSGPDVPSYRLSDFDKAS